MPNSKWTAVTVVNKEKHFVVSKVEIDEQQRVTRCVLQAVINGREQDIDWRSLNDHEHWQAGWR